MRAARTVALADNFNGIIAHLNQRDVTLVAVCRARPYEKLAAYRQRMAGASSGFRPSERTSISTPCLLHSRRDEEQEGLLQLQDAEPDASEREGVSVFTTDAKGKVFRTYSTFARGIELLNLDYKYLDVVPRAATKAARGRSGCAAATSTGASPPAGEFVAPSDSFAAPEGRRSATFFHICFRVKLVDAPAVPYPCASVRSTGERNMTKRALLP